MYLELAHSTETKCCKKLFLWLALLYRPGQIPVAEQVPFAKCTAEETLGWFNVS